MALRLPYNLPEIRQLHVDTYINNSVSFGTFAYERKFKLVLLGNKD